MAMFHIDPSKHPHPRRYRRALGLLIVGVVVGLALTAIGLAMVPYGYDGARVWLVTLSLIGPSIIFLTAVGYATYLERLERATYGSVYEDDPPAHPAEGLRQVP